MKKYILAHDIGTSGTKAVLFDTQTLCVTGDCTESYPTLYPENGFAEHNPEQWWKAVCTATKKLLEQTKVKAEQIAAISFSAIMNTCLPVDKDGKALRNAIIWADQRGESELPKLYAAADENAFYDITGHRINCTYAIAKMLWLKEHESEVFKKTYKFLQAKDFIIHKMTGSFITDYSDASHVGILNMRTKQYESSLLKDLNLSESLMPEIKKSVDEAGRLSTEAARECGLISGIPVITGGGDGSCATAGAGVYEPGMAYNVLGTSSWNGTLSKTIIHDPEKVCFSLMHLDGIHYMPLGTMQSAGHSLEWLMNNLFPDFEANKTARFTEINKQIDELLKSGIRTNLIYLPYLMGERSPWWNPDARGAFIGLHPEAGRAKMIQACMEGVAFNLKIILDSLEKNLGPLSMILIGGGARNRTWIDIIASIWEKEIKLPKYLLQATSIGAVLCAGIGSKLFDDFSAVKKINPIEHIVQPHTELQKHYRTQYKLFIQAYEALAPVYAKISSANAL
ncbi:FGGY-family carbohydrate kinase [Treponema sp. HNW]|uniref:xylulokinase n=1 Tax=Treponema sp. HNW TaxID=3116654 RepID=UPI003D0EE6CF